MSLILNIDTATEIATISIAENGVVIGSVENRDQKDHASFLQPAIKRLLLENKLSLKGLNSIAVTAGPGSYTGLRVGIASAKGLCYALKIPLIAVNTLEVMAFALIKKENDPLSLYCSMIDARRMEVFTAVYNFDLQPVVYPQATILHELIFIDLLKKYRIYFCGSGSKKLKEVLNYSNTLYVNDINITNAFALLSYQKFYTNEFSSLIANPIYIKEFYTPKK